MKTTKKAVSDESVPSSSKQSTKEFKVSTPKQDDIEILEKENSEEQKNHSQEPKEKEETDLKRKTSNFNFTTGRGKYGYDIKDQLGKMIADMKNSGKYKNDRVYSSAVRKFFPNLKNAKFNDRAFLKALQMARRSYENYINPEIETPVKKLKRSFR